MQKLEVFPSSQVVVGITFVALVAAVIVWLQFPPIESYLKAMGYGITDYELAFTAEHAGAMLDAWGPEGQAAMRTSLLIDFGFIPAYALALAGITLLAARAQGGWLARLGFFLTLAALAAGLFDVLENLMLLILLGRDPVPGLPPLVAGISASIKFAFIILVFVYWPVCGAAWLVRRIRTD
jgi:hypothetical protein